MRTIKWLIAVVALLLSLLAVGLGALYHNLTTPLALDEPQTFSVAKGASTIQIGQTLAEQGWLSYPFLARVAAELNPDWVPKVGKYEIKPGMTILDTLALFDSGETIFYPITLLEGHTYKDYLALMEAKGNIEMTLIGLSDKDVAQKLGLDQASPEGMLFANTYRYHDGDSDLDIFKQASALLQQKLQESWSNKAESLPYDSPYEALIMASIIEKETGVPSERPLIARVFVSRLEKGMRLQTDPTVIYGMRHRYDGNIRRSDLREKTAYNTYQINGLPPTPIANVGVEAIQAALNPGKTDALYFVAKGDGSHEFSKTLREHNAAVARYQRFRRSDSYRSSPSN